jgi:membrane-bound ClpP family serine protease
MPSSLSLAYVLIAAGFLLLIAELFIPSGGILSVLSAAGIIVGVLLTFMYDPDVGVWTLVAVGIALPVFLRMLFEYWPKTAVGKRMFLNAPDENATLASMPEYQELELLRGQIGQTMSALRPAGVADFGGKRIDCMTEGIMVERGQTVRCIEVKGNKVIVRPVEKPRLGDLETADFS